MSNPDPSAVAVGCGLAAEILRRFGALRVSVTGCSMLPLVGPGDVLIVHRKTAPDFATGEIAVFTRHQRLFAHRVVGKILAGADCLLFIRGDALLENDPRVSAGELLGGVTEIVRGSRRLPVCAPEGWRSLLARLGRRSSAALRTMGRWHGLRRRLHHSSRALSPWSAPIPPAPGVIEKFSP